MLANAACLFIEVDNVSVINDTTFKANTRTLLPG